MSDVFGVSLISEFKEFRSVAFFPFCKHQNPRQRPLARRRLLVVSLSIYTQPVTVDSDYKFNLSLRQTVHCQTLQSC